MSYGIDEATALMGRDYLLLAFLVNLGVLQIATTISGSRGLWLLPWKRPAQFLGVALVTAGVAIFVLSPMWVEGPWAADSVENGTSANREWGKAGLSDVTNARTLNDIHGGLDGNDYAIRFPLSALLAFIVCAIVGGINVSLRRPALARNEDADGLDALAHDHYLGALSRSFRVMQGTIRKDLDRYMADSPGWSIPKLIEKRWRGERV